MLNPFPLFFEFLMTRILSWGSIQQKTVLTLSATTANMNNYSYLLKWCRLVNIVHLAVLNLLNY